MTQQMRKCTVKMLYLSILRFAATAGALLWCLKEAAIII